jgi:hypothetical protein
VLQLAFHHQLRHEAQSVVAFQAAHVLVKTVYQCHRMSVHSFEDQYIPMKEVIMGGLQQDSNLQAIKKHPPMQAKL